MTQQRPSETDEEYEKRKRRVKLTMMGALANGGGSIIAAAAIYYQDNGGNFLYIPDGSGNLVLDNKGSLGPTYDGLLYSGRGIELGATNDVDIPIHHTLGAETITAYNTLIVGDETSAITNTTSSSFDLAVTVAGTATNRPIVRYTNLENTVGTYVKFSFDITVNSGTCILDNIIVGGTTVVLNETMTSGSKEYIVLVSTTATTIDLKFNGTNLFDISVSSLSQKQITNPNSYLTYYDFTDGLVTVDNSLNTPSTKYTLNTKTINNILTHTTNWSALDWSKINNNPNLVGKLAIETLGATKTIAELDMELDQGASADSYYMCSENEGAYLVDSRVAYGAEKVTGYSSTIFGDEIGTATPITGGVNVAVTTIGTQANRPSVLFSLDSAGDGGTYLLSFDYTVNSGTAILFSTFDGTSTIVINETLSGSGTFYLLVGNFTYNFNRTYFDGRNLFNIDITNASIKKVSSQSISDYASTVRTNADLQQKGIQTTAFVTDGAGVPTSFTGNILNFTALEYIDTQWNPSLETEFWLEEVIDGVVYQHNYDGVNLTTYTDNVAGAPAAHSPENASYLLGKGVYPKVTANPYTSYQAKAFKLYNGVMYANYNQPARYTILAAL